MVMTKNVAACVLEPGQLAADRKLAEAVYAGPADSRAAAEPHGASCGGESRLRGK